MSAKNFKFVSPGVFLKEIDQSRLPSLPDVMGPCIIGTADQGPAFRPVMLETVEEFESIFGAPSMGVVGSNPGDGQESDIFREGTQSLGVDYGALAARGYLENNSPVTFIRVLGSHDPDATSDPGKAGWTLDNVTENAGTANQTGGAFGLFVTTQTGLDSIRIPVLQTAVVAAAHVVEITIPEPAADTAMNDDSVFKLAFRSGRAIGADDLIITTAETGITHAAGAPNKHHTYATAIATALTAGLPATFNGGADAAVAVGNKVTITGPDNGDTFELVLIDEPTKSAGTDLVDTPVDTTVQGSDQGVAPAGALLKLGANAGALVDVVLPGATIAAINAGLTASQVANLVARDASAILNANGHVVSITSDGSDLVITPATAEFVLDLLDKDAASAGLFADLSTSVKTTSGEALTVAGLDFQVTFGAANVLDQGRLAAIFHSTTNRSLRLGTTSTALGTIVPADASGKWTISEVDENGDAVPASSNGQSASFGLSTAHENDFIRRKFNKNPTLLNPAITATSEQRTSFLAESYEGDLERTFTAQTLRSDTMRAVLLPLANASNFQMEAKSASTPWVCSQSLTSPSEWSTAALTKLFMIESLDAGDSGNRYKVAIGNISIKQGAQRSIDPYCTFSVKVYHLNPENDEIDSASAVLSADLVNLNPRSSNFIGRIIGDQRYVWDPVERRVKLVGNYKNTNPNFRVVLSEAISNGTGNPDLVPCSFHGPQTLGLADMSATAANNWNSVVAQSAFNARGPAMGMKKDQADQVGDSQSRVYFGLDTHGSSGLDHSHRDLVRRASDSLNTDRSQASSVFSLELLKAGIDKGDGTPELDVNSSVINSATKCFFFDLTGRTDINNTVSNNGEGVWDISTTISSEDGLKAVTDRVGGFIVPMSGGFDGLSILDRDPLSELVLSTATSGLSSSPYYTIEKAISMLSDPEFIECNIIAAPGIVHEALTNKLISTAERRGDTLAVIDLPNVYYPKSSRSLSDDQRAGSMKQVVNQTQTRGFASSYACAYAPWLQVRFNATDAWVPPSTIAIPTMGKSAKTSDGVWFAPAGFSRGGLNNLLNDISILDVSHNLTSKQRDDLYEQYVNPIASFPNEDIVIFGQKTLQGYASALDRINVRRLLIHVKKRVAQLSMNLLFEPNIESTWLRFKNPVEEFLSNIKAGGGLMDYQVVLDDTTTTPDLIDRNIMYAKILLKPTRAIEFIALDFVVTNTGVSVND